MDLIVSSYLLALSVQSLFEADRLAVTSFDGQPGFYAEFENESSVFPDLKISYQNLSDLEVELDHVDIALLYNFKAKSAGFGIGGVAKKYFGKDKLTRNEITRFEFLPKLKVNLDISTNFYITADYATNSRTTDSSLSVVFKKSLFEVSAGYRELEQSIGLEDYRFYGPTISLSYNFGGAK